MKIIRHYVGNDLRNYNYLVGCQRTGLAVAIDPLDSAGLLRLAEAHNWQISHVINTHEHFDHIDGNPGIKAAMGALICAHEKAAQLIPGVDEYLHDGDDLSVGDLQIQVRYTPGHTAAHICLLVSDRNFPHELALLSGDTLFNAAAGNCRNGGNVSDLFESFERVFSQLDDSTALYPGHDYLQNNLAFALNCDPSNQAAIQLTEKTRGLSGTEAPVMTLGNERQYNPFLRLTEPVVQTRVIEAFPELSPTPRDVFIGLRRLRDNW